MATEEWTSSERELRKQLEPLLDMFPVAIAEVRAMDDARVKKLEAELVEMQRYVAAAVAQLHRSLPLA